jgi:GntR family transcriptional regulator
VIAGPSWDVIAKDIRDRIRSGEYPAGEPIPSTTKLMDQHGTSKGPVRQAIDVLKGEGILAGHPGKAVYVTGVVPDSADGVAEQMRKMQEDIADLKADVAELQGQRGIGRTAGRRENGRERSG